MNNPKFKNTAVLQYGPAKTYRGAIASIFIIAITSVLTVASLLASADGYYTDFIFSATTPTIIGVISKSFEEANEFLGIILAVIAFIPIAIYAALGFLSTKFKPMMLVAAIVHIVDTFVLVIMLGFTEILPLLIHVLLCAEMLWAFFKGATKSEALRVIEELEREQAKKNAEQSADNSDNEDLNHYFGNK